MLKPGYKTTELYTTAATVATIQGAAIAVEPALAAFPKLQLIAHVVAQVLTAIQAIFYMVTRTKAKNDALQAGA